MSMDVEGVEASGSRLPSLSYPEDPYPPLRTQAAYDSQLEGKLSGCVYPQQILTYMHTAQSRAQTLKRALPPPPPAKHPTAARQQRP